MKRGVRCLRYYLLQLPITNNHLQCYNITMSFLSNFFKKETSVLGVDVGASAIKVVQIKKKRGRAVLETYGELALGPYANIEVGRATNLPPEKRAEAIKDILRE